MTGNEPLLSATFQGIEKRKGGIGSLCPNVVEVITILPLTKPAFDWNALQVILPTLSFESLQRFFIRLSHLWIATMADIPGGAILPLFKVLIIPLGQCVPRNAFRPVWPSIF